MSTPTVDDIEFTMADLPDRPKNNGKRFDINGHPYRLLEVSASSGGTLSISFIPDPPFDKGDEG